MPKQPAVLTFARTIAAPVAQVYKAFSSGPGFREWLVKGAEVGSEHLNYLFLLWEDGFSSSGQFEDLKENARVRFTWRGLQDPHASLVTVTLTEEDDHTALTLEHSGLGEEGEWAAIRGDLQQRWQKGLDNLKEVLETGFDQRVYQRPMMGILIGQFITSDVADKRNLPIRYGHQIAGVLPKMGADNAGLVKDDIILRLDGVPIKDFESINDALRNHLAGDVLDVEYLRNEKVHTAKFTLSSRAKPTIPANARALADTIGDLYKNANAKMQEILEGATAEQAEHRPAAQEWNTHEVLAHLILSDRDMLNWATSVVHGKEVGQDTSQMHSRLKGLVLRFPEAPRLVEQLGYVQDETVAFLADLPAEFIERKSSYTRVAAAYVEETPYHYKDHIGQIEKNLAAARALN